MKSCANLDLVGIVYIGKNNYMGSKKYIGSKKCDWYKINLIGWKSHDYKWLLKQDSCIEEGSIK